jgi:hypothetical protein
MRLHFRLYAAAAQTRGKNRGENWEKEYVSRRLDQGAAKQHGKIRKSGNFSHVPMFSSGLARETGSIFQFVYLFAGKTGLSVSFFPGNNFWNNIFLAPWPLSGPVGWTRATVDRY